MNLHKRWLASVVSCILSWSFLSAVLLAEVKLESVATIWGSDQSELPHNAFPDLVRFQGHWYAACREALKHHGGLEGKGRLRVIRSADGKTWESAGLFVIEEGDLRDAKLSITDQNELMLNSAIQVYYPDPVKHKNFAWFSRDGQSWSEPVPIGQNDVWLWRVSWHKGTAYGVGYPTTRRAPTKLYKSDDGRKWQVLVEEFHAGNESALVFDPDDRAVCLLRGGFIGQARPPYTEWTWRKTINLGGPDLLRLENGRYIAGGRAGWGTMKLYEIDPDTGKHQQLLALPAQGDSSYPGFVYHDEKLWVCYYSSSDDSTGDRYPVPCEIRLARVNLDAGPASALNQSKPESQDLQREGISTRQGASGLSSTTFITDKQQLAMLKAHPEIQRFREMREAKAEDPYRPLYHFSTPEGVLNDPNGFCLWQGNYHLFYQLQAVGSGTMQWGHAYSKDLVRWHDLPIAIHRDGGAIFSGQTLVEEDRVVAIYHNTGKGNCVATATDPLLLNLVQHPANPVISADKVEGAGFQPPFDPCIWKGQDGRYYALSGTCKDGSRGADGFPVADLFCSHDLEHWKYLGLLIEDQDWKRVGLGPGDDAAVPNFWPIGRGKHLFLWFSHGKGAHALVGTYDQASHRFTPERYHRMTFGPVYRGTLHAPSATRDAQGRLLAMFNVRENKQDVGEALNTKSKTVWYGVMTLARHFWLADDDSLRVAPTGALESLRHDHYSVKSKMSLEPEGGHDVLAIRGQSLELQVVLDPGDARQVGLHVLRSPDGEEYTAIVYDQDEATLTLDVSQGSRRPDVPSRAPEIGPLQLQPGELLSLRIFVDRSIVEVFANQRQCLTARVYPAGRDSETVSAFCSGSSATLCSLEAWRMHSIWPELE